MPPQPPTHRDEIFATAALVLGGKTYRCADLAIDRFGVDITMGDYGDGFSRLTPDGSFHAGNISKLTPGQACAPSPGAPPACERSRPLPFQNAVPALHPSSLPNIALFSNCRALDLDPVKPTTYNRWVVDDLYMDGANVWLLDYMADAANFTARSTAATAWRPAFRCRGLFAAARRHRPVLCCTFLRMPPLPEHLPTCLRGL